jgi:hypothetical protein
VSSLLSISSHLSRVPCLSSIKRRDPLEIVLALVMEVEKRQRELQAVAAGEAVATKRAPGGTELRPVRRLHGAAERPFRPVTWLCGGVQGDPSSQCGSSIRSGGGRSRRPRRREIQAARDPPRPKLRPGAALTTRDAPVDARIELDRWRIDLEPSESRRAGAWKPGGTALRAGHGGGQELRAAAEESSRRRSWRDR